MGDVKAAADLARLIMSEAYVQTYGEDTDSCVEYEEADVVAHIEADRTLIRNAALLEAIAALEAERDDLTGYHERLALDGGIGAVRMLLNKEVA